MTSFNWRTRARAAAIHLGGSAIIAALAAALVFLIWYPHPYELMAGGLGLFQLIISVDVVIGPLITFTIFNRAKPRKELISDLLIVTALQVGALAYGLHTMASARPVGLVFEKDRFRVVATFDVLLNELPRAQREYQQLSWAGPRLMRTADIAPADKLEALQYALRGNDIGTRPSYWRAWDDVARQEVRTNSKPLTQVSEQGPQYRDQNVLAAAVAKVGAKSAEVRFIPLLSRYVAGVVLVDGQSGDVLGFAIFGPA